MSVLVQRPQQLPGLMSLHRSHHAQHNTPKRANQQPVAPVASPRQSRRPNSINRTAQAATTTDTVPTRSSKRRNTNAPTTPTGTLNPKHGSNNTPASVSVSASTYSPSQASARTVKSPSNDLDLSAPTTTLAPSALPATPARQTTKTNTATFNKAARAHTQERRRDRARSPPEFNYDEEQLVLNSNTNPRSAPTTPAAAKKDQRNRHNVTTSPAVALLFAAVAPTTPSVPAPVLAPAFPIPVRPTTHQRAPSYPTLPTYHHHDNPFFVNNNNPLEALFASQLNLASSKAMPSVNHPRGVSVSASLPVMGPGIHAHMGGQDREPRQRTPSGTPSGNNGRGFAGASFQHAPDAMSMPLPFPGKMKGMGMGVRMMSTSSFSGSSSEESSSDSDGGVVNLDEEDDGLFF